MGLSSPRLNIDESSPASHAGEPGVQANDSLAIPREIIDDESRRLLYTGPCAGVGKAGGKGGTCIAWANQGSQGQAQDEEPRSAPEKIGQNGLKSFGHLKLRRS